MIHLNINPSFLLTVDPLVSKRKSLESSPFLWDFLNSYFQRLEPHNNKDYIMIVEPGIMMTPATEEKIVKTRIPERNGLSKNEDQFPGQRNSYNFETRMILAGTNKTRKIGAKE